MTAKDNEAATGRVGKIAKVDDRGLVYGWASVVVSDGEQVVDRQGDVIPPAALEDAMVEFMKDYRQSGEMHEGEAVGTVVEAFTMTPEKLVAMGFDESVAKSMPVGAWIGVQLDPTSETFAKVKSGELGMFSIQGTGERVEV
jgi:hypothetical protein